MNVWRLRRQERFSGAVPPADRLPTCSLCISANACELSKSGYPSCAARVRTPPALARPPLPLHSARPCLLCTPLSLPSFADRPCDCHGSHNVSFGPGETYELPAHSYHALDYNGWLSVRAEEIRWGRICS